MKEINKVRQITVITDHSPILRSIRVDITSDLQQYSCVNLTWTYSYHLSDAQLSNWLNWNSLSHLVQTIITISPQHFATLFCDIPGKWKSKLIEREDCILRWISNFSSLLISMGVNNYTVLKRNTFCNIDQCIDVVRFYTIMLEVNHCEQKWHLLCHLYLSSYLWHNE
jgi:acyl carrier protein phosphodiesterase